MTPANAFLISILVFVVMPSLILIIGTIVFSIKPKYARIVGFMLINVGGGELIAWQGITRDFTSSVNFLYLLTLLIGVTSLAYAYRVPKK